jgi:hypothetical protein
MEENHPTFHDPHKQNDLKNRVIHEMKAHNKSKKEITEFEKAYTINPVKSSWDMLKSFHHS